MIKSILFGLEFLILILFIIFQYKFKNHLKNKYPHKFKEFGKPNVPWVGIARLSSQKFFLIMLFTNKLNFDETLKKYSNIIKISAITFIIILISLVALIVYGV